jgi:hypothetical protein
MVRTTYRTPSSSGQPSGAGFAERNHSPVANINNPLELAFGCAASLVVLAYDVEDLPAVLAVPGAVLDRAPARVGCKRGFDGVEVTARPCLPHLAHELRIFHAPRIARPQSARNGRPERAALRVVLPGEGNCVHLPDPLYGSPPGMSFRQAWEAWVNCVEWVSTVRESMGNSIWPLRKLGSGKSVMPCERMQAAASR